MAGQNSLSDFWRLKSSTDETEELNSLLEGAAGYIGFFGSDFGVRWGSSGDHVSVGESSTKMVELDYTPLIGETTPFSGEAVDKVMGVTIHECGHIRWSYDKGMLKNFIDRRNLKGRGRYKTAIDSRAYKEVPFVANIIEDFFVENKISETYPTLGAYLREARKLVVNKELPNNVVYDLSTNEPCFESVLGMFGLILLLDKNIPKSASRISNILLNKMMMMAAKSAGAEPNDRMKISYDIWEMLNTLDRAADKEAARQKKLKEEEEKKRKEQEEQRKKDEEQRQKEQEQKQQEEESEDLSDKVSDILKSDEKPAATDKPSDDKPEKQEQKSDVSDSKNDKSAEDEEESEANESEDDKEESKCDKDDGSKAESLDKKESSEPDKEDDEEEPEEQDITEQESVSEDLTEKYEELEEIQQTYEIDTSDKTSLPESKVAAIQEYRETRPEDLSSQVSQIVGGAGTAKVTMKLAPANKSMDNSLKIETRQQAAEVRQLFKQDKKLRTRAARGLAEGNLDIRHLAKAGANDYRVFQRDEVLNVPSLALGILLDASGSMKGQEMDTVVRIASAFKNGLDGIDGIDLMICSYSTGYMMGGGTTILRMYDRKMKEFRPNAYIGGGTPSGAAIAGMVSQIGTKLVGKDKMLIHVTDGAPNSYTEVKAAVEYCKKNRIQVITLNVGGEICDEMKVAYSGLVESVDVIEELPDAIERLLAKRLRMRLTKV